MKRFVALLASTWWLWLAFVAAGIALTLYVDRAFIVAFPIYLFTFVYFAFVRFDDQGNRRAQQGP